MNHLPLAEFLNAIVDADLKPERFEEPGEDDYPLLLAVAATR